MNKHTINNAIAKLCPIAYKLYIAFRNRQRKVCNGNMYPDTIFYIIGSDDLTGGLFWLVNKVVMHLAYADTNHWTSVVDFQNNTTQYTRKDAAEKINVWELFFEQPCHYTLKDIANAKNIIYNKREPSPTPDFLMGQDDFYNNPNRLQFFKNTFQKYIVFNQKTLQQLETTKQQLFKSSTNVVGVLCRGTDYVLTKPKGHPVQPSPSTVINDARNLMEKYHCDKVFLATEDLDILEEFKESFGDQLLYIEQERFRKTDMKDNEFLADMKHRKDVGGDPWQAGMDYLTAIWLLTQCKCFLGGRTGGTKGVLLMSKGFEYQKTYDLGTY